MTGGKSVNGGMASYDTVDLCLSTLNGTLKRLEEIQKDKKQEADNLKETKKIIVGDLKKHDAQARKNVVPTIKAVAVYFGEAFMSLVDECKEAYAYLSDIRAGHKQGIKQAQALVSEANKEANRAKRIVKRVNKLVA